MLSNNLHPVTSKVENTSIFAFKRFKKRILKGILIVAASLAGLGSAQAQQWNGNNNTLDPITRPGLVSIGANINGLGQALLVGSTTTDNRNIGQLESGTFGAGGNSDVWSSLGGTRALFNFGANSNPNPFAFAEGVYGLRMNFGAQSANLFLQRPNNSMGGTISLPILQWSDNSTTNPDNAVPFVINRRLGSSGNSGSLQIMRLNANGNVGIGTQNPNTRFEVESINDLPITSSFSPMSQFFYSRITQPNATLVAITVDAVNGNTLQDATVSKGIFAAGKGSLTNIGISGFAEPIMTTNRAYLNIGVEGFSIADFGGSFLSSNIGVLGLVNKESKENTSVAIYGDADGSASVTPAEEGMTLAIQATKWAGVFKGDVLITGALIQPSDLLIKSNIKPMTKSVDLISKLKPSTYYFKESVESKLLGLNTKVQQNGLIAQELEEVIPSLVVNSLIPVVTRDSSNPVETVKIKTVNYVGLIPYLVEAIKEQKETIDSLKTALALIPKPAKPIFNNSDSKGSITAESLKLWQNAPNPTNGKTDISYAIPNQVVAYLELHDLSGNKVYKSEGLTGSNKLSLDLTRNMPGVYVYILYANGFQPVVKSLILTR